MTEHTQPAPNRNDPRPSPEPRPHETKPHETSRLGVADLDPDPSVVVDLHVQPVVAGRVAAVDGIGEEIDDFFESIPVSVEEQARIDSAGTLRIFWSMVLPMARPAVMTIPVAVVFFMFQKRIMNSTTGAVKE